MLSRKSVLGITAIVVVAAGGLLAFRPAAPHAVEIGETPPAFSLPTLDDGGPYDLREHSDRVVLINFWATWCPPCVEEAPSLERFALAMRPKGVDVVGVSVDQDAAALQKFVGQYRLSFPVVRDPEQTLASRYGTFKFPETYILDRKGRVAEKIIGSIDWQDPRIAEFVEALAR